MNEKMPANFRPDGEDTDRTGDETVEVSVGGGAVTAVMTGQQQMRSVTITRRRGPRRRRNPRYR
ncbi:MAG: YbaB/EbfC family nucleoid-associated protein [Chloroflexia bacterium]